MALSEFGRTCAAMLFMFSLLLGICFIYGITPDGIEFGQWPTIDDHPTNYNDPAVQAAEMGVQ